MTTAHQADAGWDRLVLRGWWAVGLVAIGAAVAQGFGRFTYGLLLPAVRDDLGISNSMAGLLGTVNVGAYLVGTLLTAKGTSRFRLLDVLRVGFVFSAGGLLLAALAPDARVFALALGLTGLGGACIWIPAPAIASDAVAPERRDLAVALLGAGIGTGILFSSQLAGYARSVQGDRGWRVVYGVHTTIAAVVIVATVVALRHHQTRPAGRSPGFGGFTALRRMPGWRPLTVAYTAFGFSYLLVIAFLTSRLEDDSGWTGSESGLAFTLLGLAVIPGGVLIVAVARRVGVGAALAGAFVTWSALALAVLPGRFGLSLAASIGLGLIFASIPAVITIYVVENAAPDDFGPSFSAATLAFGVAQMVSPQVGGLVADLTGSFTTVFALSAAVSLVGAGAAWRLRRS